MDVLNISKIQEIHHNRLIFFSPCSMLLGQVNWIFCDTFKNRGSWKTISRLKCLYNSREDPSCLNKYYRCSPVQEQVINQREKR